MRTWSTCLAMAPFLATSQTARPVSADDDFQPAGKWKLVFLPQDLDLVLLDVTADGDSFTTKVLDSYQQIGKVEMKNFAVKGNEVTFAFQCALDEIRFKGAPVTKSDDAGAVLGVIWLRGNPLPGRLEKSEAEKIQPRKPNPDQQAFFVAFQSAMRTKDPQEKVKKLVELVKGLKSPSVFQSYTALFQSAEAGGLTEEEVRQHLGECLERAAPYGPEWTGQCRLETLRAIQGKRAFATLGFELAEQAKQELAEDASLELRGTVLDALARAARLLGKDALADKVEAELVVIEGKLDDEYHAKVPPFPPETFAGREKPDHDRVLMFELFTGAQCPPCVAADVAFDALLSTYRPTELITLQYHLHIPGPDPLTNPDAASRAEYYAVRGTPSTYFNGKSSAGGGGGMAQSKGKYDQFRQEIDKQLAGAKLASIELQAKRSGNKITVTASAHADAAVDAQTEAKADVKDEAPADAKEEKTKAKSEPRLRMRVALTEESIRYVGGNRLRFHHHVVRGFPGGVEGQVLEAGTGKVDLTIDLNEVRQGLTEYLDNFAKGTAFPVALPKIDFKGLAVVVFVQDDNTKRILHAVQASVPEAP